MSKYYPPELGKEKFHCPYCDVFAKQNWGTMTHNAHGQVRLQNYMVSICYHCDGIAMWHGDTMIVPNSSSAPMPHEDMPEEIKSDYLEACSILNRSPRGSAALLRLSVQKLMKDLGEPGKNINTDIASLVKKGLPEEVQQALDILRVIGNEAVHPGELDLRDDLNTAIQLFELINFIIEDRITRKKKISTLFARLPENKREEIVKRDNK